LEPPRNVHEFYTVRSLISLLVKGKRDLGGQPAGIVAGYRDEKTKWDSAQASLQNPHLKQVVRKLRDAKSPVSNFQNFPWTDDGQTGSSCCNQAITLTTQGMLLGT